MTKGIETITIAERSLWESWKHEAKIHNGYDVRNKYHRECSMDMWWEKKNRIDKLYRMLLSSHNNKRIAMKTPVRRSARISCRKNNLK